MMCQNTPARMDSVRKLLSRLSASYHLVLDERHMQDTNHIAFTV
jgi:hypothetical protein